MIALVFTGHISKGASLFAKQLVVPGASDFPIPIPDWPAQLHAGTLNFKVSPTGFPAEFLQRFGTSSVKHLDSRQFKPLAELPAASILNNTLPPTSERPDKGNAQIWKATIRTASGHQADCWVLRRIGSGYGNVLECVSKRRLRIELDAPEGESHAALLMMEGQFE